MKPKVTKQVQKKVVKKLVKAPQKQVEQLNESQPKV